MEQVVLLDRLAHLQNKKRIKENELGKQGELPKLDETRAKTLKDILAAIKKIQTAPEKYGLCEECGQMISLDRLERMPEAKCCLDCQTKKD